MEYLEEYTVKRIEELIKLSVSILNIYDNLCRLEKAGQKNSEAFQKYVSYLKLAVEVENEKIKSVTKNEEQMNAILYYLEEKYSLHGADAYYDYVYFNNESRAATRIMETIEVALDDIEYSQTSYEDDYDDYEIEYCDLPVNLFKVHSTLLKTNLYYNLISMNDSVLLLEETKEESVKTDTVNYLKELYMDYKYNMAFVDKDIEKTFIINNFNVNNLLVLSLNQQAECLNIPLDEYKLEKRYNMANDVFTKIMIYGDTTDVELLLPANSKRRTLTLWHLSNTLNFMGYNQLKEVEYFLTTTNMTNILNDKDKETLLDLVSDSMVRNVNGIKNNPNQDKKTYRKKK